MNKNKIIFAGIGVVLLISIIYFLNLMASKDNEKKTKGASVDVHVWVIGDDANKISGDVISDFKTKNSAYENVNYIVDSFPNYEDYNITLASAFMSGKAPDIFVRNNNEISLFEDKILGIPPELINPQDFRKNFKQFMGEDLIASTTTKDADGNDVALEFLKGVPVGYETLGIFFNRRYFESQDVASWAALSSATKILKEANPSMIGIGIGNGTTVPYSYDIISQFFLLDELSSFDQMTGNKMKEALSTYLSYGDTNGDNAFNNSFVELSNGAKNVLDLFSREDVASVIGYPRMLREIDNRGFKKNFLIAAPFPHYFLADGKTLVNYDYFVVNRDSQYQDASVAFLAYLATEDGQKAYLKSFSYYLPGFVSLEADILNKKVNDNFNIVLRDFYNSEFIYSSFNKGLKMVYDKEVPKILDDQVNAVNSFESFTKTLACQMQKVTKFENLSAVCK